MSTGDHVRGPRETQERHRKGPIKRRKAQKRPGEPRKATEGTSIDSLNTI